MLELLKSEFLGKLEQGAMLSCKNKSVPVMNYVKMDVAEGMLSFTSTDGHNTIKSSTSAFKCGDDLSVCIDARSVIPYVRMIRDESVCITFEDDGGKMRIKHSRGVANFPTLAAEDFPVVGVEADMSHYTMPSAKLRDWVSVSRRFVASDNLRPVMCGMHLYKDGSELGCCATDGRSLFADKIMDAEEGSFSVTIDNKVFAPLLAMLPTCEEVRMSVGEGSVIFKFGFSRLMVTLTEGKYPNFKSVIPDGHRVAVSVDRGSLVDALQRASILGNKTSHLVRLDVDGLNLNVAASDLDFSTSAAEDIACDSSGNITIGLNADRLSDCLASVSSDRVRILMLEDNRPVIVKDEGKPGMTLLLMPMMLN